MESFAIAAKADGLRCGVGDEVDLGGLAQPRPASRRKLAEDQLVAEHARHGRQEVERRARCCVHGVGRVDTVVEQQRRHELEFAECREAAPAVPVFAEFQRLVEAPGFIEGPCVDQHDAAIDDEVSGRQPRQHVARGFSATLQKIAAADLLACAVDQIVIAIDENGARRSICRQDQCWHRVAAQAVVGIEEQQPTSV